MTEDRIVDIEIKVTRHDDMLDALNQIVYRQQKKIDQLEKLCAELVQLIKDASSNAGEPAPMHEKPPHY